MNKFVEMSRRLLLVAGVVGLLVSAGSVFAQDAASASSVAAEVIAPVEVAPTPEAAAAPEEAAAPAAPVGAQMEHSMRMTT